jgi:hypothetical protein
MQIVLYTIEHSYLYLGAATCFGPLQPSSGHQHIKVYGEYIYSPYTYIAFYLTLKYCAFGSMLVVSYPNMQVFINNR